MGESQRFYGEDHTEAGDMLVELSECEDGTYDVAVVWLPVRERESDG